jgi:hypothetical protein
MPQFLLTATAQDGKRETVRLQADTAGDALRTLESIGYVDITLHTDDADAAATEMLPPTDEKYVSPAESVQLRSVTDLDFFLFLTKKLYVHVWWLMLIAIAVLVRQWWISSFPGFLGVAAMILLALPLILSLWSTFFAAGRKFQRMLEAGAWGRWQEVLDRAQRLRGKVPEFELDARAACAMAGLGRLDEGLATLGKHANSSDIPRWMYYARLAEVYDRVQQDDESLRCYRLAHEDAPDNPQVMLDLAMALLKNETDLAAAQQLIAAAEQQPLGDVAVLLLPFAKGLAALNSGNSHEAEQLFRATEDNLRPMAAGAALVRLVMDVNRACLAIALANLGEKREAETVFAIARPRLEALDSSRLIDRYERSIGTS